MTAPNETCTLFVYGTLMRRSGSDVAKRLQRESVLVGEGWTSGQLYSLGYYPGLVQAETDQDTVHGEVVRLINPARSLDWIDAYEGCGRRTPEPHLYERVMAPVALRSGSRIAAWAYFYKGNPPRARRIPGGRFFKI